MPKRVNLDKDKLIELREQGKTVKEIADFFGVTKKIVTNNINRYSLQVEDRRIFLDKELFVYHYNNGESIESLMKIFCVSKGVIVNNIKYYSLNRTKEDIYNNTQKTLELKYGKPIHEIRSDFQKKAYKTFQDRTGLENPFLDPELQEKKKKISLEKYGVENPHKNKDVINKTKNTNIKKYGGAAPTCSGDVREKIRLSYLKKTGYDNPSKNPDVQEKKIETFKIKYGTPNSSQQNFSEKTKSILLSKESFKQYLMSKKKFSVCEIAEDLSVSESTIYKTAHKFNIFDLLPVCISNGEVEVKSFIESLGVKTLKTRTVLESRKELDIYCPDNNIAIEYNGLYWHSDICIQSRLYHYNKSKECEEKGIRLIHIYEDEWNDPVKKEILKSLIKISLGKVDSKIYARQCEIKEITNKEAKLFNDKNHIQGHRNAKITYGLYYKNELVQLMSFSWNSHHNAWEIIRGCPGSNNIVVGGVSKLFKHFIKENNPDRVFSYCDYNKFNGVGYEAIGMKFVGETKFNKWYVFNNKRHERNPSKYKLYNEIKDCIIYGAGSKKYLWTNPNINKI